MIRRRSILAAATLSLAACGEPPEPPSVENSTAEMAANIEAMARNMEALASANAADALPTGNGDMFNAATTNTGAP